jgi:small GTP-binding protein
VTATTARYIAPTAPGWGEKPVLQKKIAMLGMWGVGKTSLVKRFVESQFDEKYHSTIGVKVDKKGLEVEGRDMMLMLWDIAGAEDHFGVPMNYVKGAAGYLLVMDGTHAGSLDRGLDIVEAVGKEVGQLPFVVVINKADLPWEITPEMIEEKLTPLGCTVLESSAKTGQNVDAAFEALARAVL